MKPICRMWNGSPAFSPHLMRGEGGLIRANSRQLCMRVHPCPSVVELPLFGSWSGSAAALVTVVLLVLVVTIVTRMNRLTVIDQAQDFGLALPQHLDGLGRQLGASEPAASHEDHAVGPRRQAGSVVRRQHRRAVQHYEVEPVAHLPEEGLRARAEEELAGVVRELAARNEEQIRH